MTTKMQPKIETEEMALDAYFEWQKDHATQIQPSATATVCVADGWELNNANGLLAFVGDDGTVLDPDQYAALKKDRFQSAVKNFSDNVIALVALIEDRELDEVRFTYDELANIYHDVQYAARHAETFLMMLPNLDGEASSDDVLTIQEWSEVVACD